MASPWLRSRRDGRLGPRGLKRGTVTVEQRKVREGLISSALDSVNGDPKAALGVLASCAYELAFRIAEHVGPPIEGHSAWLEAIGELVFQPTARILDTVATFFSTEAANFRKWHGEHIEHVSDRIGEAAHVFGADLAKQVGMTIREDETRSGQPMTREEFDNVRFEGRVRSLVRDVTRMDATVEQGLDVMRFALADALDLVADHDVHKATTMATAAGTHLLKKAKQFEIGSLRTRAHWETDGAESARLSALADALRDEAGFTEPDQPETP